TALIATSTSPNFTRQLSFFIMTTTLIAIRRLGQSYVQGTDPAAQASRTRSWVWDISVFQRCCG
ncbi:MAG: hypothetical protein WBJ62_07235, partial [Coriobacteriia bacterium]